ncbi:autotransporter outer membrane beta-barrel domain-containing protein [Termitidicoccus mucosus]|uniref:Autotransporter domain-containing protein n=1 Tax=Termitidicoccus mucosus TaxID=1184151 RepID=A0A178IKN9_9BACT|nr:hypothetical protein AW736_08170 [Opitutaceae bacterium TSB47]
MKITKKHSLLRAATVLASGITCLAATLNAQLTLVPDHFTDWTGAVNSDWFNSGNWSTGVVPDGPTAAVRLLGSSDISNKTINLVNTGTGDKRVQLYSIQTGMMRLYTLNLEGTEDGWMELNPTGKGFTFNGFIGNSFGTSLDITAPESTGGSSVRLAMNVTLNSYSRLTLDDSYSSMRVLESGLSQAVITMKGNSEMNLANAGMIPFVTTSGSHAAGTLQIGGLSTEVGTVVNLGTFNVRINDRIAAGEIVRWSGLLFSEGVSARTFDIMGGGIVIMDGMVSTKGLVFRPRGGNSQYIVDGLHSGNINVQENAMLGGSGNIKGNVIVSRGGNLNPGMRATATDKPLTITGTVTLNGNLSFDLVTPLEYDRLVINGDLIISPVDATNIPNLTIGRASTFPYLPGTYTLMTVNGARSGDFEPGHIALPPSMSLVSSWQWNANTLEVSFAQMPFSSPEGLDGKYLTVARRVDEIVNAGTVRDNLFDALNRQPSMILYRELLDQLSPSTYQSWFPASVVRANAMMQSIEDRMWQDAAYARKKGSVQLFLDGYRQEASRDKNDDASYSDYGTIAALVGADYAFGENFVAGGFYTYEISDFDLDTAGGNCDVSSHTFGIKARYNAGNFQFNLTGFYGTDDYDSERTVALTQLASWADADASGTRIGAAASLAYTKKFSWFEVTPVAGVQWLNWKVDAFTERNANEASLYVYEQNETSLQGKLGLRVARSFKTKHGFIRPFVHFALLHEFESDIRTLSANLFGGRIDIAAPATNANGYRLDAGIDYSISSKWRAEARYTSEYNCVVDESRGLRFGVNYTF